MSWATSGFFILFFFVFVLSDVLYYVQCCICITKNWYICGLLPFLSWDLGHQLSNKRVIDWFQCFFAFVLNNILYFKYVIVFALQRILYLLVFFQSSPGWDFGHQLSNKWSIDRSRPVPVEQNTQQQQEQDYVSPFYKVSPWMNGASHVFASSL